MSAYPAVMTNDSCTCGANAWISHGCWGHECAFCGEFREDAERTTEIPETPVPASGSWADIARIMSAGDDSGFDWDAWKDEMKESEL